jgi:universal stress protein E
LFVCDTKASREARFTKHACERPGEPFLLSSKALLESLARPLRERGLDVTTETECAEPLYAALIDRTKRTTAGLVVKDTHHHSLAQRTFLTNTDWHLIRDCPVPLLLTKTSAWGVVPRILAAIDPGHANDKPALLDDRILEYASLVAKRLRGELHIVHTYIPTDFATASTPPMVVTVSPEQLAYQKEVKLGVVNELVAGYEVPPWGIHIEVGGAGDLLPRIAGSLEADVMVMGAIARSGLKRTFIGSTAEDVLEPLPCDALIVKPPNFADMLPF